MSRRSPPRSFVPAEASCAKPRTERNELIALLRDRGRRLGTSLPLVRAVLFGSWAIGRATAFSDIDLLVVYDGPPRPDAYGLVKRTVALPGLKPHVYSREEAEELAPVIEGMIRQGVALFP